jgi:hypothetical protein
MDESKFDNVSKNQKMYFSSLQEKEEEEAYDFLVHQIAFVALKFYVTYNDKRNPLPFHVED